MESDLLLFFAELMEKFGKQVQTQDSGYEYVKKGDKIH